MNACSCNYAERETENRRRWDDSSPRAFPSRLWPPLPVWHRPDCESLEAYPFVPMNDGPCAKCGSDDIRTRYHGDPSWTYTAHPHDYWRTDLYIYQCALTQRYRPAEHLDQSCGRCGFAWLAEIATTSAVAR